MMLYTNNVEETYTVEQFIELGNDLDGDSYSKFAILSKSPDSDALVYAEHNVMYDYEYEIKKIAQTVEMTDLEHLKYKMKPKLLSYDLYGTTELYFMILFVNGMYTIKDFDRRTIKLISRKNMAELLEMIYNAESNYLNSNRSSINYT